MKHKYNVPPMALAVLTRHYQTLSEGYRSGLDKLEADDFRHLVRDGLNSLKEVLDHLDRFEALNKEYQTP